MIEGGNKLATKKESQISEEMTSLQQVIGSLFEQTCMLNDRLCKVLRLPAPVRTVPDVRKEGNPVEELVPLAEELRARNEKIRDSLSVINSILIRLEL